MWIHNINPTLLSLGPLEIRYYGLVYVLGFFLGIWWMFYARKKGKINLNKEDIWDLAFYLMIGVLIGSRLFEIFWYPSTYLAKPLELLMFWKGGMSFHGGFVGIVLAGLIFCKKKKVNFWKLADIMSIPTMLALALGRIANFINGELVGRIWNGKLCVKFPDYSGCRHPSTLYAAGKRFIILGWLMWLNFKEGVFRFKEGFIFWNFVFFEGLGRILVDFYRQDPIYYGFTLGQWFSAVMVLVALLVFIKFYRNDWKKLFS